MATQLAGDWQDRAGHIGRRTRAMIAAVAVLACALLLGFALASYHPTDAALNTAAGGETANVLGPVGAWVADLLFSGFGLGAVLLLPPLVVVALRLWRGSFAGHWIRALVVTIVAMLLVDAALGLLDLGSVLPLPAGMGGVTGLAAVAGMDLAVAQLRPDAAHYARLAAMLVAGVLGLTCAVWSLGLDAGEREALFRRRTTEDGGDDGNGTVPFAIDAPVATPAPPARIKAGKARRAPDRRADVPIADPAPRTTITAPTPAPQSGARGQRERQAKLDLGDTWVLPTLSLLGPLPKANSQPIDHAAVDRNARLLETVLEDFHVRGQINNVRPGPVVTLYELEPAAGIKASRVTALSDDIARNMSALSARIATVPGRTVIGIELPNQRREPVVLSELIDSPAFDEHPNDNLPLVLGKNISGEPVIADLAPMPHLLVAGTTGSGKSVGLNAMIVSLLYKLTPFECRMIMIDPKMLELSVYDEIPHLLSPVVTEPAKAIRALKWAVEQMEDRYRMMASVGVRSLSSFNEKVRAAKTKGQPLGRRVQTGYDAESGQPIYEEEKLDFEPLFKIVIVVDELADLMMTAGKEVEFLIQRLAQKARAAGIHLIMATQRPSVDVITGVIKANLPTRISFSVTSKIDSRTILGEQGAEQLLGKGDMLYMPGGKQIIRVHGPFVSDDEVRAVAEHWKAQRAPEYVNAVTEEGEDASFAMEGAPAGDDSPEAQLYRKAVQVVAESQKASTSYVQRQLRIGYNSAARLIDRMEKEGVVGSPDHVGRRDVLIDRNGQPV